MYRRLAKERNPVGYDRFALFIFKEQQWLIK
jgi:hypothetical protein